uniref:Uncharacterized protein n=1 Tax=Arundo donax TaxID=35708 RepID=A0A0A9H5F4_ARUDO
MQRARALQFTHGSNQPAAGLR